MTDPFDRADELFGRFEDVLRGELPPGAELFDAHTHLGHDIDGMVGRLDELLGILDRYGFSRANVFCLDEHDRVPAFRAGNDRTLAFAEQAGGRLIPFVRLDLTDEPIAEAERCLDRGARGIKLHPRAQKFALNDDRLAPVFAIAAERRVPILIHGGRGLPPIADHLARLVELYPDAQLIIAHAGIADLSGLAGHFAGKTGVFFDTSVWSPIDLLSFFRLVPPEQIVYASDYPYGLQPQSLLIMLRTARAAGLTEDEIVGILAGNAVRIADGLPPLEPSEPKGADVLEQPMAFARIHQYLSMAMSMVFARQPDQFGALGLALNATYERNGHRDELDQIRELLEAARELWRMLPEAEDDDDKRHVARTTNRLIHLADIVAVTTSA
ncbi:MAG TPA: amidohydrolase family protein [Gaiellaceae bacterium]|nr:amidohydrolase family protein [Gaiellaceae bacterium]